MRSQSFRQLLVHFLPTFTNASRDPETRPSVELSRRDETKPSRFRESLSLEGTWIKFCFPFETVIIKRKNMKIKRRDRRKNCKLFSVNFPPNHIKFRMDKDNLLRYMAQLEFCKKNSKIFQLKKISGKFWKIRKRVTPKIAHFPNIEFRYKFCATWFSTIRTWSMKNFKRSISLVYEIKALKPFVSHIR